jgi:hypothetical protein
MADTLTATSQAVIAGRHRLQAVIAYEPNHTLVRWPCVVCGGHTDKQDPMASASCCAGSHYIGDVCDGCATADPDTIREQLITRAERLELMAQELREWATFDWSLTVTEQQCREANPGIYDYDGLAANISERHCDCGHGADTRGSSAP